MHQLLHFSKSLISKWSLPLLSQADYVLLLCEQQCFQSTDIIGQVGEVKHRLNLRKRADVYKADDGSQVHSGRRLSMPSNSIDGCA
jgi:hypothetical protein